MGLGLGKQLAMGSLGILKPTVLVDRTPQEMEIDGVRFVFQNVPGSEAPAKLTFYLHEKKAFFGAELVSRSDQVDPQADAVLRITYALYLDIVLGKAKIREAVFSDDLEVEGSKLDLIRFFALLDTPDGAFNIVGP
ncbi:MAG: hypothetical protein GY866_30960 [Proteobacteria bacterium]|nr:hypothetical protein [Pseudomonadota bacterium]